MDAGACLEDMLDACRREGVEVRFGAGVSAVVAEGGRARGVRLAAGGELAAGTVVNCLGPWFKGLNATAGVETSTRMVPVRIQVRAHMRAGPFLGSAGAPPASAPPGRAAGVGPQGDRPS